MVRFKFAGRFEHKPRGDGFSFDGKGESVGRFGFGRNAAVGLLFEKDKVCGVKVRTKDGEAKRNFCRFDD